MSQDLLFENFNALLDDPREVQKMRELILQLAVQGKLVPQDPNDEPASTLLKKIKVEKKRLIKEGKIKKTKPLPPIDLDEMPYELPDGWEWVRLGDIGRIVGGGTPKTNRSEYFSDNGIPWLTPADLYDLKGKYIDRGKRDISKLGLQKSSAKLMPAGTVLFSSRAPIGYVAIALNDISTNQGFKSCVPFILEMNEYIYYFLLNASKKIERNAPGTTFKEVSGKIVSQVLIPLPPLNEQERIVAKVDQLMAICDRLEEQLMETHDHRLKLNESSLSALLDTADLGEFSKQWQHVCDNFDILYVDATNVDKLKEAILQLAVQGKLVEQIPDDEPALILLEKIMAEKDRLIKEKKIKKSKPLPQIRPDEVPCKLPNGWEWVRLEALSDKIHYGYNASADFDRNDVRLLRITDIQNNKVNWETVPGCRYSDATLESYGLSNGDILIARTGGTIGKSYLVENLEILAVFASYLIRVVPNKEVLPRYVKLFLESPLYWQQLYEKSMGTGQPNVNGTSLKSLVFPLPPITEQKRIVAKVDQLMALCDDLKAKIEQSQEHNQKLLESVVADVLAG